MGSPIKINDTLKLQRAGGFPAELNEGEQHRFVLPGRRIFNLSPSRVFLVEEVDGKWNYRGHALVLEQTIDTVRDCTSGTYRVTLVYSDDYRKQANAFEAPAGQGYID